MYKNWKDKKSRKTKKTMDWQREATRERQQHKEAAHYGRTFRNGLFSPSPIVSSQMEIRMVNNNGWERWWWWWWCRRMCLDSMTFIYERDLYFLMMYRHTKNKLSRSSILKVIVLYICVFHFEMAALRTRVVSKFGPKFGTFCPL